MRLHWASAPARGDREGYAEVAMPRLELIGMGLMQGAHRAAHERHGQQRGDTAAWPFGQAAPLSSTAAGMMSRRGIPRCSCWWR